MATRQKRTRAGYAAMQNTTGVGGAQGEAEVATTGTETLLQVVRHRKRSRKWIRKWTGRRGYEGVLKGLGPLREGVRQLEEREGDNAAPCFPAAPMVLGACVQPLPLDRIGFCGTYVMPCVGVADLGKGLAALLLGTLQELRLNAARPLGALLDMAMGPDSLAGSPFLF